MRRKSCLKLWTCTGGIALAGLALPLIADAQSVTGNLTTTGVSYGQGSAGPFTGQLTVQTITTAFGASTYSASPGPEANGSELDAAYGASSNGYLYLFFSGNLQDNGNLLNVFIQAGSNGSNTLNAPNGAGTIQAMNGSVFSSGFAPTYAFELNDTSAKGTSPNGTSTLFLDQFPLTGGVASFVGSVPLTTGIGASQNINNSGIKLAINNSNISTMGATGGLAYSSTSAQLVGTGIEIGIPLSTLGNPVSGSVEVMADLNGGSDGGVSNQALPGLNVGNIDIKNAPGVVKNGVTSVNPEYVSTNTKQFTFANTPGEFFTVSVPVTAGIWIPTAGGTWNSAGNWTDSSIPNSIGATASFSSATTSSLITLDGPQTVSNLNFNTSNAYTLSAGSGGSLILQASSGAAQVIDISGNHVISAPVVLNSPTTVTEESNGSIFTISGNISGTGSLTTAGEAVNTRTMTVSDIVLSGSNSYTGGTEVLRGNLQLGSATAIPNDSPLTLDGFDSPQGTLDLNGYSLEVSKLTTNTGGAGSGQIANTNTTSGGTATFTYAGNVSAPDSYPGAIMDSFATGGSVTALDILSGSLTLTGTNTYAGGTMVAPGAGLTIASSNLNGSAFSVNGTLTNNGSLTINDNIPGGVVAGSGTTDIGVITIALFAGFTQTGGLVNDGLMEVLGPAVVGPVSGSGALTIDSSLQLVGGPSTIASLTLSSGTATVDLNGNTLTLGAVSDNTGDVIGNSSSSPATLVYAGSSSNLQSNVQDGFNGTGGMVALSVSAGSLSISGSNNYTGGTSISSGASLTVNSTTALPAAQAVVNNGSLTINNAASIGNLSGSGSLTITAGTTALAHGSGTSSEGSLSVSSGASLDVGNNIFLVNYGSGSDPIATIQSYLSDGYAAGWAAGEIDSSSVAASNTTQSALIYGIGYADGADGVVTGLASGQIEIRPTLVGDAKLSGNVVFGDFQLLAANFGSSAGWDGGNFTYGSIVNFGDFQLLAQNFGNTASGLTASELSSLNNFAEEFGERMVPNSTGGFSLVAVPEPASIGLLAASGLSLLSRRRRRKA